MDSPTGNRRDLYHNPPRVSGVDTGMVDAMGGAMFGHEHWKLRRRRAARQEAVKTATRWLVSTGCLVTSTLLFTAAIIALVLLVHYLWEQL